MSSPGGEETGEGEIKTDSVFLQKSSIICSWPAPRKHASLDGSRHGHPDKQAHDTEREKFLKSRGIKTLRFWNSHLRGDAQNVRDIIFNELQRRTPHPLPDYTRPMKAAEKS
jgi:hypothetical protein